MSKDDDDKVKKLLDDAHARGALSTRSLHALDVVDVGAQIQAGLGVTIDDEANAGVAGEGAIEIPGSPVEVRVVHAREDVVVARAVRTFLRLSD